jgi:hypothetical protein
MAAKCPPIFKQLEQRNPNKAMHLYLCEASARMVPSEWEATRDMFAHRKTLERLALSGEDLGPSLVTAPRPWLRFYVLVGGTTAGPTGWCEDHHDNRFATIWHTFLVSRNVAAGGGLKSRRDIRHLLWHRWDIDLARLIVRPVIWSGQSANGTLVWSCSIPYILPRWHRWDIDLARLIVRPVIWSGQSANGTLVWSCSIPYILPPGSVLWAARATVPRKTRNGFLSLPRTITWRVTHEHRILSSGLVSRPASGITFKTRDDTAEDGRASSDQHFVTEIQYTVRKRYVA